MTHSEAIQEVALIPKVTVEVDQRTQKVAYGRVMVDGKLVALICNVEKASKFAEYLRENEIFNITDWTKKKNYKVEYWFIENSAGGGVCADSPFRF